MPRAYLVGTDQVLNPEHVARAAEAEPVVQTGTEEAERAAAADRARQMSEAHRFFGIRFTDAPE
jgi:hypothetical protein